ncbi:HNH nuclease [Rahnella sp. AA]|uniref:HNH nuclease n=1 Tax=Rahnella sp. AA TaxID=2057180 RepID=UPI000C34A83A|nr:HNH nuclease [Rahnella sp. AA]
MLHRREAIQCHIRTFGSFDSFRRAFWKAVAYDPELSKQFDPNSLDTMKNGRAPYVRKQDRVGKRVKIELHHKQEISKDGDVYNVDNLNAVTPKDLIEIQKGN